MRLYHAPGACSQAVHILLHEIGIDHDATAVDLATKRTADGRDFLEINPKGCVPALELDDGEILTENAVVLQYIADKEGANELLPAVGSLERYRVLEWVNFVATELHKSFSPLFNPKAGEETRSAFVDLIGRRFDIVERRLDGRSFLTGETFTIADAYLFVVSGWAEMMNISLDRWPNIRRFRERVAERPAVRQVLEFEGLTEEEALPA